MDTLFVSLSDRRTLGQVLVSDPATSVEACVLRADRVARVGRLLTVLKPKEQFVLRRRFGLETGEESTLAAIGAELGCTRERVRQIEEKALERLRRHPQWKALR
jgi:RNA polymerase sigma factor (sigma-70 family)